MKLIETDKIYVLATEDEWEVLCARAADEKLQLLRKYGKPLQVLKREIDEKVESRKQDLIDRLTKEGWYIDVDLDNRKNPAQIQKNHETFGDIEDMYVTDYGKDANLGKFLRGYEVK